MTDKKTLRVLIRTRKQQHTATEMAQQSDIIMSRLLRHQHISAAHTIMLYAALPDEVSTQRLLDTLLQAGKTILLPKVVDDKHMTLHQYTGPESLAEGAFHIMEPTGDTYTHYEDIEVAVVPGMAFDAAGHRLGRGRGYYDRFLSKCPHIYKIGICFDFQKVDTVPHSAHDIVMDEVL